MAELEKQSNLESVLKPFYQRASEAEDRLSELEASLPRDKGAASDEHLERISELELELKNTGSELNSEREKAKKLALENDKLRYRIHHLIRAVKEAEESDDFDYLFQPSGCYDQASTGVLPPIQEEPSKKKHKAKTIGSKRHSKRDKINPADPSNTIVLDESIEETAPSTGSGASPGGGMFSTSTLDPSPLRQAPPRRSPSPATPTMPQASQSQLSPRPSAQPHVHPATPRMSPPASMNPLGPVEGLEFDLRRHLHETPIPENRLMSWEPWRRLQGANIPEGTSLQAKLPDGTPAHSDLALHIVSGSVLNGDRRQLHFDPQWVEGAVRNHLTSVASLLATETEIGALAVQLTHKCAAMEDHAQRAAKAAHLEKEKADWMKEKVKLEEDNALLRRRLDEEVELKDGAVEKAQFAVDKANKFAQQLAECEHASNQNMENARRAEKNLSTATKEKEATLLQAETAQKEKETAFIQLQAVQKEKEVTLTQLETAKVEAVTSFKKTAAFEEAAERHLVNKIVRVYENLVTQIREAQPDFPLEQVQGFKAFLWMQQQNKEAEVATSKAKAAPKVGQKRATPEPSTENQDQTLPPKGN